MFRNLSLIGIILLFLASKHRNSTASQHQNIAAAQHHSITTSQKTSQQHSITASQKTSQQHSIAVSRFINNQLFGKISCLRGSFFRPGIFFPIAANNRPRSYLMIFTGFQHQGNGGNQVLELKIRIGKSHASVCKPCGPWCGPCDLDVEGAL